MTPTSPIDSHSWLAIESPEFAHRFGRLLTTTRLDAKASVDELLASGRTDLDAAQLLQFEQGVSPIDESIVEALCLVYSADIGRILPARLPVVIGDGRLWGSGLSVRFSRDDPTSLLVAYLRLIRRMRNQKRAPAVALRRDDIITLALHLDIDGAEVVDRLSTLMNVSATQRNTMAMLFAAGAIVIGLAAGGHASASSGANPDAMVDASGGRGLVESIATDVEATTTPTTTTIEAGPVSALTASAALVEPSAVAVLDRPAAATGLSTATRVSVPVTAPPLVITAPSALPNQSGCNPDASEAVMTLVIPDIAYTCPVYPGGQPMIDAGFVTLVTDAGANPVLATRPGDPGTLWLAGHRTTRGAAFAQVPDLADGALVSVSSGGATATYRVVGRSYVEVRGGRVVDAAGTATATATWASIIRSDFSGNLAPRLVLQTCEGDDFRWMIYADLVSG